MQLYIKNITCDRCAITVSNVLVKAGLTPVTVTPDKVLLAEKALTGKQMNSLRITLTDLGFELIDEQHGRMIEQIKETIISLVQQANKDQKLNVNFSAYLSYELNKSYPQLSNLFSTIEGITIKQFIIQQKTERVKEMLDQQVALSKIAMRLSYSSIQHLSAQFKKTTGLTPIQYKQLSTTQNKPASRELTWETFES